MIRKNIVISCKVYFYIMAIREGGQRNWSYSDNAITWVNPDEYSLLAESVVWEGDDREPILENKTVDLEFEWRQLCHGCNERKWFSAMICDNCRKRYRV